MYSHYPFDNSLSNVEEQANGMFVQMTCNYLMSNNLHVSDILQKCKKKIQTCEAEHFFLLCSINYVMIPQMYNNNNPSVVMQDFD